MNTKTTDSISVDLDRSKLVSNMAQSLETIQLQSNIDAKIIHNNMADKHSSLTRLVRQFEAKDLQSVPVNGQKKHKERSNFIPLQEWEGYVLDIQEDLFTASLLDLTNKREVPDEEAEFAISEIAEPDVEFLSIGAVFRWVLGYRIKPSGQSRESQIIFRRMPKWNLESKARADRNAERLMKTLSWK